MPLTAFRVKYWAAPSLLMYDDVCLKGEFKLKLKREMR